MEGFVNFGGVIERLRKKKRLTRKQFVRAGDPITRICSEKTLERIERGDAPLTVKHLDEFISVLGISYSDFFREVDGVETMLFLNGFGEVWDLLFEKKYGEAENKMERLTGGASVDLERPLIKQAVMLYDCRIKGESGNDGGECIEELCKALYLTSPNVVKGKDIIDLNQVSSNIYTLNEYRIMNVIASLKEYHGDMVAAVKIYIAMKDSLEIKTLPSEIRNKALTTVCYNLADSLTSLGKYGEAAKTSEAGLKHGKAVGNHSMDGMLFYSLAKAQHLMGETDKAVENFNFSYISFKIQGKKEMAETVRKFATEKYDVHIVG